MVWCRHNCLKKNSTFSRVVWQKKQKLTLEKFCIKLLKFPVSCLVTKNTKFCKIPLMLEIHQNLSSEMTEAETSRINYDIRKPIHCGKTSAHASVWPTFSLGTYGKYRHKMIRFCRWPLETEVIFVCDSFSSSVL